VFIANPTAGAVVIDEGVVNVALKSEYEVGMVPLDAE
jgi:hypothetical protein